jgi:phosphopantothenoylcysteine decarboxylase / phosphopantothenate---cysteine ligase
LEFVGRATWEALSGAPVTTGVFDDVPAVEHVSLGRDTDLVIVAPATANLIARAASGMCDDLLTAALLTVKCPVLIAPAMHTEMWLHPATQENVKTLRRRGIHVLEPAVGRLTGADSGPGRLPEPTEIAAAALALVGPQDLRGRRIVVTAGGTREPLDPVRFLGNRSTGRQGFAIAEAAVRRGAEVVVVAANVALAEPSGVQVVPVETTEELSDATTAAAATADVVVMAAAVADYRPVHRSGAKLKKSDEIPPLELTTTTDVLVSLVQTRRRGQVIVGFAAETGDDTADVLTHGAAKARRKGADLLVVNAVGEGIGFGDVPTEITILDSAGQNVAQASGSKHEVAEAILDEVSRLLN